MGHIPVAKPSPILREWTFPRRGLLIALLLLGMVALGGVALSTAWPSGVEAPPVTGPHWLTTGIQPNDLQVDQPVLVIEAKTWLVKLQSGEIIALWRRDPHLGCAVPWRPEYEFNGMTGWFRNPCHSQTYDLTGACFDGPCIRGLDRFKTRNVNGHIDIRVGEGAAIDGPPVDTSAAPYVPVWEKVP